MLTKITKTSISITAENEADYFAMVESLKKNLDFTDPEKLALIDENYKAIINTNNPTEIAFLNNLSDAMVQAEIAQANKINYLQKTAQGGQEAFLTWRSIVYDFLVAKKQALFADASSTLYADITNRALLTEYKQFLFYYFAGMLPELKEDILALPNTALLLKEFYPIGQTTTTVKDIYIQELDKIMAG